MSAKKKIVKRQPGEPVEKDSVFFLKLVVYVIAGTFWLKLQPPIDFFSIPVSGVPMGLFLGLIFASHDHFQIDRKIEYAVLIIVTIVSYFLPAGIVL